MISTYFKVCSRFKLKIVLILIFGKKKMLTDNFKTN